MSPPEPDAAAPGGDGGNLLLARLLAHEFLSSGTVLGERCRLGLEAEAARVTGGLRGGAHVPGVVNPAQLATWAGR